MLDIWLGSTVLLLLAVLFLLWPIFKKNHRVAMNTVSPLTQQSINVAVFKDRLMELEREQTNGLISAEKYNELLTELEAGLLSDAAPTVDDSDYHHSKTQQIPKVLVILLVISLPVISWLLYMKWGAYDSVADARTNNEVIASEGMPDMDIDELLKTLELRLKENPENVDGWFLLGRSYMNMGKYEEAVPAYNKVATLLEAQGEDASSLYGLMAQALYFSHQGMSPEVQLNVDKALRLNPNEINSLGLIGMQSFDQERYADAIKYWQRILEVAPQHPSRAAIEEGISKARQRLTGVPQPVIELAQDAATVKLSQEAMVEASLSINVDIAPELKLKSLPTDTVFVYARATNGPKMPLAIVRKQVQDLPLKVVLDDSMAMGPMAKLSSVAEVEILARVSKQGSPAPNPGDFEGKLGPIDTLNQLDELYVLIETTIK